MADPTAAGQMLAEAVEPIAQPVQLPLLPAARLDALPVEATARQVELRRPGRPAGAINRATADWRDYILARYASPLVALAETYSRSVHDLAAELGCTRLEAAELQRKAATELAPYLHGKMPVDLNINGGRGLVQLTIVQGAAAAGAGAALIDGELLPNQGDS